MTLNTVRVVPANSGDKRPPILFVHGAWHGAWCWQEHFLHCFAQHGYEAVAVDLRGHGKSPAVTAMRWNRIRGYVDDVQSVADSLPRPPVVIGHSMGGLVCQHLMHRSKRLAGIGLLATVPTYGVWKTAMKIAATRPVDFIRANVSLSLYPLVDEPGDAHRMFLDEDAGMEEIRAFATKLSDESWLGFLDMLFLALPPAGKSKMPMLVVGGGSDTLFSPASQRHTAKRYGCDCHIVPGAPHDLMLSKHWRQAADHFIEWLKTV